MNRRSRKILLAAIAGVLVVWAATRLFAHVMETFRASSPAPAAEEPREESSGRHSDPE